MLGLLRFPPFSRQVLFFYSQIYLCEIDGCGIMHFMDPQYLLTRGKLSVYIKYTTFGELDLHTKFFCCDEYAYIKKGPMSADDAGPISEFVESETLFYPYEPVTVLTIKTEAD